MIRIGVIGCGKIAQVRHIPEYFHNEMAEISGFYDINEERAAALAQQYGGKAYDSIDSLLHDQDIDAVSVCAANRVHAEITIKALKAGKHVLCEKPMAMSIEDCESMIHTANETGKILMIAQNQRLTPAHKKVKQMISDGKLGKVITFRTTFGHGGPDTWSVDSDKGVWFFDKEKAVMGAIADLGIHKIDLIQYLLEQTVVKTTAKVVTLDKKYADGELIGVDDNAICILEMSGGTVGTMMASWTHYGEEDNSTVIYGTNGIIHIYGDPLHSVVWVKKDGSKVYFDTDQIQTNDHQTNSGVIDEFLECIRQSKKPDMSGESVLYAMKTVFASIRSSELERTINIGEEV